MARPRIALVGAGAIAELYARALEREPLAEVAGVHDLDLTRADAMARRLGARVYRDFEDLAADPGVDAAIILTPSQCHFDQAAACLRAGKHVLIEKPVAETRRDILALADIAAAAGKVCMPAHNYIYNPAVTRMRRLVQDGSLGTLASLWMVYNIFHPEDVAARYHGVLREVAVHMAYSLLYIAGRPLALSARAGRCHYDTLDQSDQIMLICDLPGGGMANLWVSFAASDPTGDPWTVVYKALGTKGGASYSWSQAVVEEPRNPVLGILEYRESFFEELKFFLQQAVKGTSAPLSTLRDAADALTIVEAAEASLLDAGRVQRPAFAD